MRRLIEFAARGDVRDVAGHLMADPAVQGVVVDYDRSSRSSPRGELVAVLRPTGRPEGPPSTRFDFGVRYERRAEARLFSSAGPVRGGAAVRARPDGRSGTAGGIVFGDGRSYAVTCGHVVSAGQSVECRGRAVGRCVAATDLAVATGPCFGSGPDVNFVDAALVELDRDVDVDARYGRRGVAQTVVGLDQVPSRSIVRIATRRRFARRARVGGLALSYEFSSPSGRHCVAGVYELRHPSRYYGLFGTFTCPARPGDSGAWVLQPASQDLNWVGVLIGGDGTQGYATPSRTVLGWIQAAGYAVTLQPRA